MELTFEKIWNYDPLNPKADKLGMVSEWVGRNGWGNAVAFGNTKKECMEDARRNERRDYERTGSDRARVITRR